jgi:hypothetical protein
VTPIATMNRYYPARRRAAITPAVIDATRQDCPLRRATNEGPPSVIPPLYRESNHALNVVANSIKMKLHQELDLLSNANLRPAQGGGLERGDAADIRQRNGTFQAPFRHRMMER